MRNKANWPARAETARVGENSRRDIAMAHCVKRTQFALPGPEKTLVARATGTADPGLQRQTKPIGPAGAGSSAVAGDKRAKQSQFRRGTDNHQVLCSKRVTASLCSRRAGENKASWPGWTESGTVPGTSPGRLCETKPIPARTAMGQGRQGAGAAGGTHRAKRSQLGRGKAGRVSVQTKPIRSRREYKAAAFLDPCLRRGDNGGKDCRAKQSQFTAHGRERARGGSRPCRHRRAEMCETKPIHRERPERHRGKCLVEREL